MSSLEWEFRIMICNFGRTRGLWARLPGKPYFMIADENASRLIQDREACIELAEKVVRPGY